MLNSNCFIFL